MWTHPIRFHTSWQVHAHFGCTFPVSLTGGGEISQARGWEREENHFLQVSSLRNPVSSPWAHRDRSPSPASSDALGLGQSWLAALLLTCLCLVVGEQILTRESAVGNRNLCHEGPGGSRGESSSTHSLSMSLILNLVHFSTRKNHPTRT